MIAVEPLGSVVIPAHDEVGVVRPVLDILCEPRSAGRWFGPRETYLLWREAWVRPVEESEDG